MQTQDLFGVSKKVVVLTGVSGQLGAKYAEAYLINGAFVAGLDIIENERITNLEKSYPNKFHFIISDITNRKSVENALHIIIDKFGTPEILVNNAAIDSPPSAPASENGFFEDYPEKSWDNVMEVNLKGSFFCCQVLGAEMAKNGKGSIINISSIYGNVSPDQSIYEYRRRNGEIFFKPIGYSVSKAGIINMSRYLAVYWAKAGVRVNTLTIAGVFNNQDSEFLKAYNNRIPVGRMANPDDYIGALLFLSTDASSYMTGSNLVIDGGWTSI
jgi:NAD(P)-dependent dehydrogenase (short-subunit alcohol dehydrogenase family)